LAARVVGMRRVGEAEYMQFQRAVFGFDQAVEGVGFTRELGQLSGGPFALWVYAVHYPGRRRRVVLRLEDTDRECFAQRGPRIPGIGQLNDLPLLRIPISEI